MQTKPQKLLNIDEQIAERTSYLKSIEDQIVQVSEAANNRLFELSGEIDQAEKMLANVLRRHYEIDQENREKMLANIS